MFQCSSSPQTSRKPWTDSQGNRESQSLAEVQRICSTRQDWGDRFFLPAEKKAYGCLIKVFQYLYPHGEDKLHQEGFQLKIRKTFFFFPSVTTIIPGTSPGIWQSPHNQRFSVGNRRGWQIISHSPSFPMLFWGPFQPGWLYDMTVIWHFSGISVAMIPLFYHAQWKSTYFCFL